MIKIGDWVKLKHPRSNSSMINKPYKVMKNELSIIKTLKIVLDYKYGDVFVYIGSDPEIYNDFVLTFPPKSEWFE